MSLEKYINRQSSVFLNEITLKEVKDFCDVIQLTDSDEKSVPITYLTKYRQGEFELLEEMSVPIEALLHGEQSYTFFTPMKLGIKFKSQCTLKAVKIKKGGELTLLYLETVYNECATGSKLYQADTVFIIRSKSG